jgi:hypothetical protein
MSDMIQHSTIAKADVETERNVILEEINMRDDDPGDLIHDLFAETLWKGHPLGRPVLGTRQTIGAVTRDQVKRFYSGRYGPPRFVVAAAGNLEHDALCALIQKHMDTGRKLSRSSTPKGRNAGDVPVASGETLVHKRKTEQAHICLGANGYSRSHPDRFAFGVVNTALGGSMYATGRQSWISGQQEDLGPSDRLLFLNAVLMAQDSWIKDKPNTVKAVMRAFDRATKFLAADRPQAVEIIQRGIKIDPAAISAIMNVNVYNSAITAEIASSISDLSEWALSIRRIPVAVKPTDIIDPTLLASMNPSLVTWRAQ